MTEAEFKHCYREYFNALESYAYTIVLNPAEAKDIVQNCFIKLWEKRGSINVEEGIKTYLFTSVYHLSLNAVRSRNVREQYSRRVKTGPAILESAGFINPSEEKELKRKIAVGIETLPPRCKEVFQKSRLEGMKYSEIANDMGISVKTVEVQMGKALKLLRENLAEYGLLIFVLIY